MRDVTALNITTPLLQLAHLEQLVQVDAKCTVDTFILRKQVNKPVPPGPMTMVVVVAPWGLVAVEVLPLAGGMPLIIRFFSISLRLRSAFSSGVSFILLIRTRSLSRARRIRLCSGSSLALLYLFNMISVIRIA